MGTIQVETPQGVESVEIAGDEPTPEEIETITSFFAEKPDTRPPSIVARAFERKKKKKEKPEEIAPTHDGEVLDASFQAFYAKADTDRGREMRLEQEFGPGTYQRVGAGDYFLVLDNISKDKKEQYGLPESGTMRVNKHGFSMYDIAAFGGAYQGPLVATLGAGLITTRLPILGAMAVMGAAGAGGKAYDELVEEARQGLQDQTDREVYGQVALEGLLMGGFEGVFRGLFAGLRRLTKGPGTIDDETVARLVENKVDVDVAKALSREQSRVKSGAQVRQGAAPTIYEATGKPIMGRLQAIWDGIFPNDKAAFKNRQYVMGILSKHADGDLGDEALKRALQENATDISNLVRNSMVDPNEAIRVANRHTRDVIKNQIDVLTSRFVPGRRQARDFDSMLTQVGRLFRYDSNALYTNADNTLNTFGPELARFDGRRIQNTLRDILEGDPITASLTQGEAGRGIFGYMANKTSYTASELNNLRAALRMKSSDPTLIGTGIDRKMNDLIQSITKTIDDKADDLANTAKLAEAGTLRLVPGTLDEPLTPAKIQVLRDGVEQFRAANKHYADNMEILNSGSVEMLLRSVRDGHFVDLKSVTEQLVRPGHPEALKRWLDTVTPSSARYDDITKVSADRWASMARFIRNDNIPLNAKVRRTRAFLNDRGISEKHIGRLPDALLDMPSDPMSQAYAKRILDDYATALDGFAADSLAKTPYRQANTLRNLLSTDWMENAMRTSKTGGEFNPASFANKFYALGNDVQNLLVGKTQAAAMRKSLKDYYLLGLNANAYKNTLLSDIADPAIRNKVASVQNVLREAEEQSVNSVFRAVKNGTIEDADSLILALVKNPKMVDDLQRIPQAAARFEEVGGIRDAAMHRIMLDAFPDGITSEAIASGSFGQNMRKTVEKMNANGALAKILNTPEKPGQQVVNELLDVAKQADSVSQLPLKGKGGLAAPSFVAGLTIARWGADPLAVMLPVIGTYAMGRVIRQPWFLNWITKPRFRAAEIQKGIGIAADDLMRQNPTLSRSQAMAQARASLGDRNIAYETFKENVLSEARAVSAMATAKGMDETSEQIGETIEEMRPPPQVQAPQVQAPQVQPAAPPQPQQQSDLSASEVYRNVELAKLAGVPAVA
jgi:hypothetical protein